MAYIKTEWVDGQAPALNAENLNKIELGIETVHTKVDNLPVTQPISYIDNLQAELDNTVDGSQVLTDVPSGAVFTDTTYVSGDFNHNELGGVATHLATEIIQDENNQFINNTDREKWNSQNLITPYTMSDGSLSTEKNIQAAFEMQETKIIFGGNF
jgi:hypothetical protein